MDKINELKNRLEELIKKRNNNNERMVDIENDNVKIVDENQVIDDRIKELNDLVLALQDAPNIIKKLKSKMAKGVVAAIGFIVIYCILSYHISQYAMLLNLIVSLCSAGITCGGLIFFNCFLSYVSNKIFFDHYNIENIQKEINEKENQNKNNKRKKEENEEKYYNLNIETEKIDLEIKEVLKELSKYEEIKNEVINELLNGYFSSEEVIDVFDKASEKVKTEEGYQKLIKLNPTQNSDQ